VCVPNRVGRWSRKGVPARFAGHRICKDVRHVRSSAAVEDGQQLALRLKKKTGEPYRGPVL
jgi:hypothetical protein